MPNNTVAEENTTALVVAIYGKDILIEYNNTYINCTTKTAVKHLAVGDSVEFNGEVITKILPRNNLLTNGGKNIASNIDAIFLTLAINPYPDLLSIDNYLLKAQNSGIDVSIIINKCDIVARNNIDIIADIYKNIGYSVDFISIMAGENLEVFHKKTQNKTCVFLGQSGVGKSSIVNYLTGNFQKTSHLGKDGLGKHTTTSSMIFDLENGGKIIDTPGVREFNPQDFTCEEIKRGFVEIHSLAQDCKFRDCNHINEPQCAVKTQLEIGAVSSYRYNNYIELMDVASAS